MSPIRPAHARRSRGIVAVTLLAFALTAMPSVSYAGLIGTAEALQAAAPAEERAANLARVQAGLERADVRAQLEQFGVDPVHAAERAAALNDAELATLAGRIDQLPAGGDGILVVIGVVFVVLLILDYVGAVNVFNR